MSEAHRPTELKDAEDEFMCEKPFAEQIASMRLGGHCPCHNMTCNVLELSPVIRPFNEPVQQMTKSM